MLYFITTEDYNTSSDIIVENDLNRVKNFLQSNKTVGFDKEFSSLDWYNATPLLTQIGNKHVQFVIDDTTIDITELQDYFTSDHILVGHNIKIDYQIAKLQGLRIGRQYTKFFDTMIAEQIITRGLNFKCNLSDTVQRRLDILPLNKEVREGFSGMSKNQRFTENQIKYAADDVTYILELKEKQEEIIRRVGYSYDLYNIEFPLISIIGDAELSGFLIDKEKWNKTIKDNYKTKARYINELDEIIKSLSKTYPDLKKVRVGRKAESYCVHQTSLFDDPEEIIPTLNKKYINYGSSPQVLKIFTYVGEEKPTLMIKDSKTKVKVLKESLREEALEQYMINNPETVLKEFILTLIELKKVEKEITSFGEKFLKTRIRKKNKYEDGYKNSVTGKVHTLYKQCGTNTTRMSSGSGKDSVYKGFYNSQQIPKKPEYREAFIADPGYLIATIDLSGAELSIAASNSGDPFLIEGVKEGDAHSKYAKQIYKDLIQDILNEYKDIDTRIDKLSELLDASGILVSDKEGNKIKASKEDSLNITNKRVGQALKEGQIDFSKKDNDLRNPIKNVIFGIIYGADEDRIAQTMNISVRQAKIVIDTLKRCSPKLFDYLNYICKTGVEEGYLQFSPIRGSRRWFPEAYFAKKKGVKLNFIAKSNIERFCRNNGIQGTQGLMIKEATVKYFYEYVYPKVETKEIGYDDITLKLQVHDENAAQFPENRLQDAEALKEYMTRVSSSYLEKGIQMECEIEIKKTWTK